MKLDKSMRQMEDEIDDTPRESEEYKPQTGRSNFIMDAIDKALNWNQRNQYELNKRH